MNMVALHDDKEPFLPAVLRKLICQHWRQTTAHEGQGYVFFLPVQEEHSCVQFLCSSCLKFLNYVLRHGLGQSICKVSGHFLWCISATSAFLLFCSWKPFLKRESVCPGSMLCPPDGKLQPNNIALQWGKKPAPSWTLQSHASNLYGAFPLQKPLRHLKLNLHSSYPLPNKPLPPPLLAWLIKLFFRKWSCCAPSSSARGYPGNPLFFTLSSYLPSFPFPIYLIRVGSFLFICRATTFEQLPNCSPASTLQSEKLFIIQITSSFQCLTISLTIESNFFRPSIVQTLAIFHHSLPFFPCLSLSVWKSFIYLKAQDFFFFGFFNWLSNFSTL